MKNIKTFEDYAAEQFTHIDEQNNTKLTREYLIEYTEWLMEYWNPRKHQTAEELVDKYKTHYETN